MRIEYNKIGFKHKLLLNKSNFTMNEYLMRISSLFAIENSCQKSDLQDFERFQHYIICNTEFIYTNLIRIADLFPINSSKLMHDL